MRLANAGQEGEAPSHVFAEALPGIYIAEATIWFRFRFRSRVLAAERGHGKTSGRNCRIYSAPTPCARPYRVVAPAGCCLPWRAETGSSENHTAQRSEDTEETDTTPEAAGRTPGRVEARDAP